MASALTIGLLFASTAMQVVGSISEGNAQKNAAKANAQVAQRNAVVSRQSAAADALALNRENRKRLGLMRVNFGSNNIALEGSALDVLEDSTATATLNELNIIHKGELRAIGFQETAEIEKTVGQSAQNQGFLNAGSAIFTGASNADTTNRILEANA